MPDRSRLRLTRVPPRRVVLRIGGLPGGIVRVDEQGVKVINREDGRHGGYFGSEERGVSLTDTRVIQWALVVKSTKDKGINESTSQVRQGRKGVGIRRKGVEIRRGDPATPMNDDGTDGTVRYTKSGGIEVLYSL